MAINVEELLFKVRADVSDFVGKMTRTRREIDNVRAATSKIGRNFVSFSSVMSMPLDKFKEMNVAMGTTSDEFGRMASKGQVSAELLSNVGLTIGKNNQFFQEGRKGALKNADALDVFRQGYSNTGAKVANQTRLMTHGLRGFRMELLGVMFFGMAFSRVLLGMLQPAMQASGLFELIGVTLQVLFLPIALLLLEVLLPLMEWFMNLPPEIQLVIGAVTLLAAAFFMIMMVVGQVLLGVGGLILFLGGGTFSAGIVVAGGLITSLVTVLGTILIPIGIIIAILAILALAWFTNFAGIQQAVGKAIEAIIGMFGGLLKIIEGVMDIVFGILELDAEKVFGGFEKIVDGAINGIIKNFGKLLIIIVGFAIDAAVALVKMAFDSFVGITMWFLKLPGLIFEVVFKILEHFGILPEGSGKMARQIWENMVNGLTSGISAVVNAFWSLIPEPFRSWLKSGKPFGEGIMDLIGGIGGSMGLPFFQHGGLVTKPTLGVVGEAGPEVITPLSRFGQTGGVGGFSGDINITVNASAASGLTADEIVSVIERRLGDEIRRLIR